MKKMLFYSIGAQLQHNFGVWSDQIGLRQRMHIFCGLFATDTEYNFFISVIYSWQADCEVFPLAGRREDRLRRDLRIWNETPLSLEKR